jgi:hypothetical protein
LTSKPIRPIPSTEAGSLHRARTAAASVAVSNRVELRAHTSRRTNKAQASAAFIAPRSWPRLEPGQPHRRWFTVSKTFFFNKIACPSRRSYQAKPTSQPTFIVLLTEAFSRVRWPERQSGFRNHSCVTHRQVHCPQPE